MSSSEAFRADLSRIEASVRDKMRQLVQGTARVLYNEMSSGGKYSPGTPIGDPSLWSRPAPPGYVGGRARGSWNAEVGTVPEAGPGDAESADAQVEAAIAEFEPGDTLYTALTVPYARRLEFDGWSQQAPDGFVRPAAEALELIVAEVAAHVAKA